jgi:hypothetical protein
LEAITVGVPQDDTSLATDAVTVQVQENDNTMVTYSFTVPVQEEDNTRLTKAIAIVAAVEESKEKSTRKNMLIHKKKPREYHMFLKVMNQVILITIIVLMYPIMVRM